MMLISIIIILFILILLYSVYLLYRNEKVCSFRLSIINKCYDHYNNYYGPFDSPYYEFKSVTYDTMLFSLKSLKEENFYSEDFCKFLNS